GRAAIGSEERKGWGASSGWGHGRNYNCPPLPLCIIDFILPDGTEARVSAESPGPALVGYARALHQFRAWAFSDPISRAKATTARERVRAAAGVEAWRNRIFVRGRRLTSATAVGR
ncbi:unnamed protein product, partial [Discosporangium mesarthrocarpum]